MLRTAVLILAFLPAIAGLWLCTVHVRGPGLYLFSIGVVTILGVVFERWHYRKARPPADARWQATGERFTDPQSGENVEVLYDPGSGERRYVGRHGTLHTPPGR